MPLSNAERQKRHRERLKARARLPLAEAFVALCDQWLADGVQQARDDGDDDEIAFMESLRNGPVDAEQIETDLNMLINAHMERVTREKRKAWNRRQRSRPPTRRS